VLKALLEAHVTQIVVAVGNSGDVLTGLIRTGGSLGGPALRAAQTQYRGRCCQSTGMTKEGSAALVICTCMGGSCLLIAEV
jgi:hypothetical protein